MKKVNHKKLIIENKKDLAQLVQNLIAIYECSGDVILDIFLNENSALLVRDLSKIEEV